ncbi:helix-turn-helix transcriptional regulator [Streptomyces spiramyceticus]|uniref:helix-turn-helix transcriptional regulator n=1 Tax=Streptomyces spiramyceticus TaxID=299717 RepID=UPI00237AF9B1|nr:helix-turn-helix transcriptional regulator [Streptomyces spiramyceticus]
MSHDLISLPQQFLPSERPPHRLCCQTLLRPGSLTFFDTTRPYTVTYPALFRMHVFQIPRWMLGVREADLRRITAMPVDADTQNEGTTVSRWILHRRLEAGRRELSRPRHAGPSVTAVAHCWGFTSTSHFSRSFRAAYGMSPRERRNTADRDRT